MKRDRQSDRFYDELQGFADFADFTNGAHFAPVPDDWHVLLTDVVDSTGAIEEGRYKDVNTIGAASISVVRETLKRELPFVFGGDGASILVPASGHAEALAALHWLRSHALEKFNLALRVGSVPVAEIRAGGARLELARYELNSGRAIGVFRGGGMKAADEILKAGKATSTATAPGNDEAGRTELKGLSCRWNPIPSKRGRILSLLVLARDADSPAAYMRFLDKLAATVEGGIDAANPVHPDLMDYKGVATIVSDERRYHSLSRSLGFLKRLVEIVVAVLIFKHRLPPVVFNPSAYRQSMRTHSDCRKFDDMLRMVIDCSVPEAAEIRTYLETEQATGDLFYGIHESDTALMTCYVEGLREGEHIHFIDGANGGYALAAKQLKAQMAEETR